MGRKIDDRMEYLEGAALEFEGANLALRHIIARLLAQMDQREAEEFLCELQRTGRRSANQLGGRRLVGYLDEIKAVKAASDDSRKRPAPAIRSVT